MHREEVIAKLHYMLSQREELVTRMEVISMKLKYLNSLETKGTKEWDEIFSLLNEGTKNISAMEEMSEEYLAFKAKYLH